MKRIALYEKLFHDKHGQAVIGQPANVPIITAVISGAIALAPLPVVQPLAAIIAFGAAFTWSWNELFDGVNLFRQILGLLAMPALVIGAYILFTIF